MREATNVVLPTIADNTTPFAYTMDPERLIQETSNAKYGDAVEFPAAASDTGVYFNNGKKGGTADDKDNIVYANSSAAQTVTNKSSHAISLTVKAEAVSAATDIPLVAKASIADADEASLYLGLVVGSETAVAVAKDTAATKTVTVAGTNANFKTAVKSDNSGYEYRVMTAAEWAAANNKEIGEGKDYADVAAAQAAMDATWATSAFQLEGAVTSGKEITSTTTAPSMKVTWSWVDPSANTAPSIANTTITMTEGNDVNIPVSLGTGNLAATGISSAIWNNTDLYGSTVTYANGVVTMASGSVDFLLGDESQPRTLKIKFNDTAETEVTVTLTSE